MSTAPPAGPDGTPVAGRPARVLFVFHGSAFVGGAERSTMDLVEALAAAGTVEPVVLAPGEGALARHARSLGLAVEIVPHPWWVASRMPARVVDRVRKRVGVAVRAVQASIAINRIVRRRDVDVVVSSVVSVPSGALGARLARRPHVWWVREFVTEDHGMRWVLGERLSLAVRRATGDAVVAVSEAVARAPVSDGSAVVIHNGIEVPPGPPVPARAGDEPLRAVAIGRLAEAKGTRVAVEAMALLRDRGCPVTLRLVGAGAEDFVADIRDLVATRGLDDRVELVGPVDDPLAELDRAHVALLCSRAEAFGRVTVEALQRGRAVVGSDSGGTRDLVDDGVTGVLVAPGDVAALADALEHLAAHHDVVVAMGAAAARANAGRFRRADAVAAVTVLVDDLRGRRGTRR